MAKSKKDYDLLDSDLSIRLLNQAILIKTFIDDLNKIKQGNSVDDTINKYKTIVSNLIEMSKDIKSHTSVFDDKEGYYQNFLKKLIS